MVSFWPSASIEAILRLPAARSWTSIRCSRQALTAAASHFLPLEKQTASLITISQVVALTLAALSASQGSSVPSSAIFISVSPTP